MFFSLFAADLCAAFSRLEKLETHSAGAASVPFFIEARQNYINNIYDLLNRAMQSGDCIAPYLFYYMKEKGYDIEGARTLPDLSLIPNVKGKGDQWVAAYKLYLEVLNLWQDGQWEFKHVNGPAHARLTIRASNRNQANLEKTIQKKLNDLSDMNTAIGNLFMAMILDKKGDKDFANDLYKDAAFSPNLWAINEYWDFLKRNNLFLSTDKHHALLQERINILKQPNTGYSALFRHCMAKMQSGSFDQEVAFEAQRFLLKSALHGESDNSFSYAWHYADKKELEHDMNESIKWFRWMALNKGQDTNFHMEISRFVYKKIQEKNTDEYKAILILEMVNYMLENIETFVYMRPEGSDISILQMILDNMGEECFIVYEHNPQLFLTKQSCYILTVLGQYFELKKDYKKAEQLHRKSLENKEDHITMYNVANILRLQKKGYQESVALFLKAAVQGCNDSVSALLGMHVIERALSPQDLKSLITIMKDRMPVGTVLKDQSDQLFPLRDWLESEYEKKLLKVTFRNWKRNAIKSMKAKATVGATVPVVEIEVEEDDTDIDFAEALVEEDNAPIASEEKMEVPMPEALDARAIWAHDQLMDLERKRMRNLTERDLYDAQLYWQIIVGQDPSVEISSKGKASGSRTKIGQHTVHLRHGHDTLSPGAQHRIKKIIQVIAVAAQKCLLKK